MLINLAHKGKKLNLKYRPATAKTPAQWTGASTEAIPPRPRRKPRNDKFQFTEEHIAYIEELSERHLSIEQMAYMLDISPDTWQNRCKENPEVASAVSAAVKRGRAKAVAAVTNVLYETALNPKATVDRIFWLKNNGGYADTTRTEMTGAGGKDLIPKREFSDEDRAIRLMSLLAMAEQRKKSGLNNKKKDSTSGNTDNPEGAE